jgi:hypothetical protein
MAETPRHVKEGTLKAQEWAWDLSFVISTASSINIW